LERPGPFSIKAAAERLKVSESTVRRWIKNGTLEPSCRAVYAQLFPYLDKELSGPDLEVVETHLRACAGCDLHFRFDGHVLRFVKRQMPKPLASDEAQSRILAGFRSRAGV
jgi:hypothetical protein